MLKDFFKFLITKFEFCFPFEFCVGFLGFDALLTEDVDNVLHVI